MTKPTTEATRRGRKPKNQPKRHLLYHYRPEKGQLKGKCDGNSSPNIQELFPPVKISILEGGFASRHHAWLLSHREGQRGQAGSGAPTGVNAVREGLRRLELVMGCWENSTGELWGQGDTGNMLHSRLTLPKGLSVPSSSQLPPPPCSFNSCQSPFPGVLPFLPYLHNSSLLFQQCRFSL